MEQSRRNFFRTAGLGAAAVTVPVISGSCAGNVQVKERKEVEAFFSKGDVILFQGDSITDAGRNRNVQLPNMAGSLGNGYAGLIAAWLLKKLATKDLTIYNRGISGNKVYQLAERWKPDCFDLEPDVLSILIGVNDYWHMRDGKYDGTPEIYEHDYRALLSDTMERLPDVKLVICQPFILTGTSVVDESWVEPFSAYQKIARKLAGEFDATWVPFQEAFDAAVHKAPATYWTGDGVHPSMAGSQLMAEAWLKALA
jgi:lysophospholipase L1-like esterase